MAIVVICGESSDLGDTDVASVIPITIEECKKSRDPLIFHHIDHALASAEDLVGTKGSVDSKDKAAGALLGLILVCVSAKVTTDEGASDGVSPDVDIPNVDIRKDGALPC